MGPNGIGKRLGVGMRVGARVGVKLGAGFFRHRASRVAQPAAQRPRQKQPDYIAQAAAQARARGRALAHGSRKFGDSVWRPFVHAGSVLWLEVTGLFFALFTLFFAQNAYRLRHAYMGGPEHQRFLLYVALTVIFVYFTFSSFYRARKKEKRNPK